MSARLTASARIDALEGRLDGIEGLLQTIIDGQQAAKVAAPAPVTATAPQAPATGKTRRCKGQTSEGARCKRVTRSKFCPNHTEGKATTVAATTARTPKGAQPVGKGALTRSTWNKTLCTLAKTQPKGSGTYRRVLDGWAQVQELREQGLTPQEVLARFTTA